MEYGYIRVSSAGQNIARQVDALHEAGITDDRIYTDKLSGKNFNRPAWKRLVKRLKAGDVLIVQSLNHSTGLAETTKTSLNSGESSSKSRESTSESSICRS